MFVLQATVTIGSYQFSRIHSATIERSVHTVGATAELVLPTRAVHKGRVLDLARELKAGMPVRIELGYAGVWQGTEFVGYLRRMEEGDVLKIQCDDALYLLRQRHYAKSWKQTTLADVVNYLVAETPIRLAAQVPTVILTPFYLKDVNGAEALQRIKEEYGLAAYFDTQGLLYVGLAYGQTAGTVRYGLQQNVIGSNLKYRNADDVRLRVKAVHIDLNNKKTEVEVGDKDASLRTYYRYDVSSEAELKVIANELLQKEKYSGYEGSLTTFLVPYAAVGMRADVQDKRFGRSGSYFVEKVKTSYGTSGARREVSLGVKLG